MTRWIDADMCITKTKELPVTYDAETVQRCIEIVSNAPAIDAVPKEKILLFLNIANEELSKSHENKSADGIMTWSASVTTLEGLLKEYDTADTDIVPVIRCKECKWWKFSGREYYCDEKDAMVEPCENDFCSLAERKPPQVNPEMVKALKDRIEKQRGEHDTAD